jgi:xanthine dehydrogenase accessory factor
VTGVKELREILRAWRAAPDAEFVLATIVKTEGSSYRRPGAHMLVLPNGETIGSISGGCLERDVIAHAEKIRGSGKAVLLSYDTTSEEDVLMGVGLGCKGVIEILLETRVSAKLEFIAKLFEERRSGVVATTIRGDVGNVEFPAEKFEKSTTKAMEDGSEIFYEVIHAPALLFIFGAGFDAIPLARFANGLGFEVTVVDRRPAYAVKERFPEADAVVVLAPEEIGKLPLNDRSVAVVMSHHYVSDRDYLKGLLGKPLRYLGVMGPRRRAEKMLEEFRAEGILAGEELLARMHNPIGLDIGAEGPEQIALAILAEITTVLSGHGGGILREKKGPIHSPRAEPQ